MGKQGKYTLHKTNPTWFKKGQSSWRKGKGQPLTGSKSCEYCGVEFTYNRASYNPPPKTCCNEHRYLLSSKSMLGKTYPGTIRYSREWKRKAQRVVQRLVKQGVIKRELCSKDWCGSLGEAHHYKGYAKESWLDIVWLCREHHKEEHQRLRRTGESSLL